MVLKEASSFRDSAGQVIIDNGIYLRRVNECALTDYETLINSGLYGKLIVENLIIPHVEVELGQTYTILKPLQIPFISYPYEWCFSMLKKAAITTLLCALRALDFGMMLKDASAYNIQWVEGKMRLIDTLSFMRYKEGMYWPGYQQFVEHFLCPLLLSSYDKPELSRLLQVNVDGIPVTTAAKLLPFKAHFSKDILLNVYLPAGYYFKKAVDLEITPTKKNITGLINRLLTFTEGLEYKTRSAWTQYANEDSYTRKAQLSKNDIVFKMLSYLKGKTLLDVGANTGDFSELAQAFGYQVIATDRDHDCVEKMYQTKRTILPLVVDLCNPSPAIGWSNTERKSFLDRLNVDTIMALALIHHLCVSNNVPLFMVAELLSQHCRNLIIEFVPLEDKKAKILLGKKTIPPYSETIFVKEFSKYFVCEEKQTVEDSCRSIYLFRR